MATKRSKFVLKGNYMKTADIQLEILFSGISDLKYENEHGPEYAYLQFLSITRRILAAIRPYGSCSRHSDAIEGINWILNEYLGMKFTARHYSVFMDKRLDVLELSQRIIYSVHEENKRLEKERLLHAA